MNSFLKQFTQREAGPIVQFIKYGICGGAAVVVHFIFLYSLGTMVLPAFGVDDPAAGLLRKMGLTITAIDEVVRSRNYTIDTVISFFFSNLTAYLLNVMWVFKPGRHSRTVEVAIFYAVSGLSFAIGVGFANLLILGLHFSTTTAFVANIITCTLINYAVRKFVIFKG